MINETDDPLCPQCHAEAWWDFQDAYELHGRRFTERALTCSVNCGWYGPVVLFPWLGNKPLPFLKPRLPKHPFDDTVPMDKP